jgi:hypothetical protein
MDTRPIKRGLDGTPSSSTQHYRRSTSIERKVEQFFTFIQNRTQKWGDQLALRVKRAIVVTYMCFGLAFIGIGIMIILKKIDVLA